jgi:hypothetical protein
LSSSTYRVLILSPSTIVNASTNLYPRGTNCSVRGGSQPHLHALKLSSPSTVSKLSMNLLSRGRRASMTTTILSYDDQITPISPIRL